MGGGISPSSPKRNKNLAVNVKELDFAMLHVSALSISQITHTHASFPRYPNPGTPERSSSGSSPPQDNTTYSSPTLPTMVETSPDGRFRYVKVREVV